MARISRRADCLAIITVAGVFFVFQAVIQIDNDHNAHNLASSAQGHRKEPLSPELERRRDVEDQVITAANQLPLLQHGVGTPLSALGGQNQTRELEKNQPNSIQKQPLIKVHQNSQRPRPLSKKAGRKWKNALAGNMETRRPGPEKTSNEETKHWGGAGANLEQQLLNENVSAGLPLDRQKRTLVHSTKPNTCSLQFGADGTLSLPTFYEDVSPDPAVFNVYLIETSSATNFTGRGLCSLESYCSTNPAAVVWFLVTSRSLSATSVEQLTALQEVHPNLCVAYADFDLLLQDTPLLQLYKSDKFRDTKYLIHNLSDLSRLAVVYKSGGFYSDMDIFLMRNVQHLHNFLALENDVVSYSSNGVFHFDRHHPMLLAIMQHASSHYDGYKWGSIGPATFTAVMKSPPCKVTIVSKLPSASPRAPCSGGEGAWEEDPNNTGSRNVRIIVPDRVASRAVLGGRRCPVTALPQATFYPITTRYLKSLFSRTEDGHNGKPLEEVFPVSVGVHLFNKLSQNMVPEEGSLVHKLATAVCPVINARTLSKL